MRDKIISEKAKVRVSVLFDSEFDIEVRRYCQKHDISVSDLIRTSVEIRIMKKKGGKDGD